ncbi:MAG TPA: EthD family reductase [Gemmatimonadales bacterium]|nr:EthD family reductase [Gemmatimonadales bacterium]
MRRLALSPLVGLLAMAACSKPAEKPAADTTAVAQPAPKPAPMAFVTVIYNQPKSPAAFEKYYWEKHLPFVSSKQSEVGFVAAELTKFDATLDGKKPTYYRQAVLWFKNMAALQAGIATPGFKGIGDDLKNFATGGFIGMIGEQTNDSTPLLQGDTTAFVTVIYNQPKDQNAFETYYAATHLPIVAKGAQEIGFTRAELTKFTTNLDGSPAALYRQAKLYWPNMAALKKGTATPAFKAVGDNLPQFADGGFIGLVGHLTSKK